jgi:signal peptidase II
MALKYKVFIFAFVLSLGLDQATKVWARNQLKPRYPEVIQVIDGFFDLRYSENPGSAFGLFRGIPGARYLLFIVGMVALAVVATYLKRAAPDGWRLAGELGLLAGGALGNIVDRVAFGRVTDFVVWKVGTHEWPTFNVADAALVVGVLGLLFDMRPPTPAPSPSDAPARKTRAAKRRT